MRIYTGTYEIRLEFMILTNISYLCKKMLLRQENLIACTMDDNTSAIWKKIKAGDPEAFHRFYVLSYPKLRAFACRFVDVETSEDVVQEVFVSFWEKKATLQIEDIQPYLYKWLQNCCLNHLRSCTTEKEYMSRLAIAQARIDHLESQKDGNDILTELFKRDLRSVIDAAADKLPPKCAQVFRYCYWEEMSHKEIAEKMGISVRTVETHIRNAVLFLREELKDTLFLFFMFYGIK